MFETAQSALVWVQGMQAMGKSIVTVIGLVAAVFFLYLLWQEPPAKLETALREGISQSGNIASTGQSGGVTAGVYINNQPPVTEQQKEQALAALRSELEELAQFPNRPDVPPPRTILEQFTLAKAPHQLFILLGKYYKPTILSVPNVGKDLFEYKTAYYDYETKQLELENRMTEEIEKIVQGRLRQAWLIYFRYFLFRSAGHTQEQIKAGGDFLNFDITWDEAERVYAELSKNEKITAAMKDAFRTQKLIVDAAAKSLASIKQQM